jgi:hypothetical protein
VIDEPEAELDSSSFLTVLGAAAIAAAALCLLLLPAMVALRVLELPVTWVGVGLGFLGAGLGGVKLIAMAWAVGGRLLARPPARAAVAAAD